MTDRSAILDLPYIMPAQAQKHVTHNEAVERLDLLVQLVIDAFDQTTPPAQPVEGTVFGVGAAPTGVWSGQDDRLAAFLDGGWVFVAPLTGWRAWCRGDGTLRVWTGSAWEEQVPTLENLDGVGVGTTSDATNRLAVSSPATLFSHAGAGHQVKVNKAATGDTASLLFQTGWSGRAEMGLAGNDDFAIKVSADGTAWQSGLSIDATTGSAAFLEVGVTGGISVGGTAPQNRLAAYEASSYTPSVIDMSGNSVSLAPKTIPYVRIGDQVSVFFNFMSNIDTTGLVGTDDIAVTLPFTNGKISFGSVEIGGPVGQIGPYHWLATAGESYARIRSLDAHSTLSVSDFTSGATDIVGGTLVMNLN